MKCKITLQERLKDLRVAHNLNLEELAKLTGISKLHLHSFIMFLPTIYFVLPKIKSTQIQI